MASREIYATGTFSMRVTIAIPAFAVGTASTIRSLIAAGTLTGTLPPVLLNSAAPWTAQANPAAYMVSSLDFLSRIIGVKIHKYAPGTTAGVQRSAMIVACGPTDTANCEYVATGEDYYEPGNRDIDTSYPRDATGAGFNALAVIYFMGSAGG